MAKKEKVTAKKSAKKKAPAKKKTTAKKKAAAKPSATPATVWEQTPLAELQNEISKVFDRFSHGFTWPWPTFEPLKGLGIPRAALSPKVDISEGKSGYKLTAELPGLDEKYIDISVTGRMLSIKGEKREERDVDEKDYHLSERSYGAFRRTFTLPEGVDPDKIDASFKKGVLTVSLPKSAEAKSKQRKISVEGK
jgi:HSP20 family protein